MPNFESEGFPASEDPLRKDGRRQVKQFSQESDEGLHAWDDTTGRIVSKVIEPPITWTLENRILPEKAPGRWRDDQRKQRN